MPCYMLPPQLGVWTAVILRLTELKGRGPMSSARCMQVFHQFFKSCWWGLQTGFFQASCGPFARKDNKSQRTWFTGRWAWRQSVRAKMTFIRKTVKSWGQQDQCLTCFPSQKTVLKFQVQLKKNCCWKTTTNQQLQSLAMLLPSGWRTWTPVQPAQVLCWILPDCRFGSPCPYTNSVLERRTRMHLQSWGNMSHQSKSRSALQKSLIRLQLLGALPQDDMVPKENPVFTRNPCCPHTWLIVLFMILWRTHERNMDGLHEDHERIQLFSTVQNTEDMLGKYWC